MTRSSPVPPLSLTSVRSDWLVALVALGLLAGCGHTRSQVEINGWAPPEQVGGTPALDAPAALASQGPKTSSDSIYFTSRVATADGREFGVLVHTVQDGPQSVRVLIVSVTDLSAGASRSVQAMIPKKDYSWSTERLDIKAPGLAWTGDAKRMAVQATTSWGSLDLTLEPTGPVMYYGGTGEWVMLGERQVEFAFPAMQTTGTLTVEGATYQVAGESWLDRQWGGLPLGLSNGWTWMNLNLSNGDKVAIWYLRSGRNRECWATVLHADGTQEVVAVEPLSAGAGEFWTSPRSKATYPTSWHVEIPALGADLTVRAVGTQDQEVGKGMLSHYEGAANVTGTVLGKDVTGTSFVEMLGARPN